MEKGSFPKPTEDDVAWFDSLLPDRPDVWRKPMFGNLAGFANDAMFFCLLGDRIAVRLDEQSREELVAEPGAEAFAPMNGRVMKEYAVLPPAWRDEPETARAWVERAADYAATLPPKPAKAAKAAQATKPAKPAKKG
jgi:TfoX/Sxy family transcriptional regulator of competence genes